MKLRKVLLPIFIMILCCSCAGQKSLPFALQSFKGSFKEIEPGSIYTGEIQISTPEAPGIVVFRENGVTIDASHTEDGYIMVMYEGSHTSRLKFRIAHRGDIYTYDLNQEGRYEVFPLQMGNGTYELQAFRQTEGTSYTPITSYILEVSMAEPQKAFVFPSQYVWYTKEKSAVKLSYDLCADLSSEEEKVERIFTYLTGLLTYDYEKAETVGKGYIPDIEEIFQAKKGICFDYAALFAVMLRAQNIPVCLVTGYIQPDQMYHAWNEVYIDGKWVWKDLTFGAASPYKEENYIPEQRY